MRQTLLLHALQHNCISLYPHESPREEVVAAFVIPQRGGEVLRLFPSVHITLLPA